MIENKIDLISKAIKNDKIALERLLKGEEANIISMLFYLKKDSKDIQDIKQDILIKVIKNIKKLKNPYNFKAWISQIIINSYYDYLRKRKKHKQELIIGDKQDITQFEIPDESLNPQNSILKNELDYIVKTSINNLPLRYKIPITLRELEGLTYGEISNITNTTLGTVKSRIARARALIKDDIDKYTKE